MRDDRVERWKELGYAPAWLEVPCVSCGAKAGERCRMMRREGRVYVVTLQLKTTPHQRRERGAQELARWKGEAT